MPCCRLSVPVALLLAALFAAGCSGTRDAAMPGTTPAAETPPATTPDMPDAPGRGARPARATDVHSYARPAEAIVHHVSLNLAADMAAHTLAGTATLTVEAHSATEVVLDTRDLTISRITDAEGAPLAFHLGAADPILGAPLTVTLPPADPLVGDTPGQRLVVVHYRTAPTAAAVQWLSPAQTASGQPFMFTQGEAILTRSWIPTQDSPGIRQTYDAEITAPAGLTAVMSAEADGQPALMPDGRRTFSFQMEHPVAPYLIALAIGDLEFRPLGERTGVWSEPTVVGPAASEFRDVEQMVTAAEGLYGPYRWGRYDLLVLPPSFPFGGMENPTLTFATPTILAGDRSLVSLVAHELAHSWSGNLVTNATWSDFWLNEGFTVYFENRIMEAVYGADYADMLRQLGRAELTDELATLPPKDQILHVDLQGRDPDDGFTSVPYEKGAAFLYTVESVVGRPRLDAFLRSYFDRNAFGSMTTAGLLAEMDATLWNTDPAARAAVRPEEWMYQPGLPDNVPPVASARLALADHAAAAFASGTAPAALATTGWATPQWIHFLNALPETLPADRLAALDQAFGLSASGNSEILFSWLRIAIRNRYEPAFPALESFLTRQGRRKYIKPLFADLAATDWGRPLAEQIYARARPTYHSVTSGSIDAILGVPPGQ